MPGSSQTGGSDALLLKIRAHDKNIQPPLRRSVSAAEVRGHGSGLTSAALCCTLWMVMWWLLVPLEASLLSNAGSNKQSRHQQCSTGPRCDAGLHVVILLKPYQSNIRVTRAPLELTNTTD